MRFSLSLLPENACSNKVRGYVFSGKRERDGANNIFETNKTF
jgi:hypothetical protein